MYVYYVDIKKCFEKRDAHLSMDASGQKKRKKGSMLTNFLFWIHFEKFYNFYGTNINLVLLLLRPQELGLLRSNKGKETKQIIAYDKDEEEEIEKSEEDKDEEEDIELENNKERTGSIKNNWLI